MQVQSTGILSSLPAVKSCAADIQLLLCASSLHCMGRRGLIRFDLHGVEQWRGAPCLVSCRAASNHTAAVSQLHVRNVVTACTRASAFRLPYVASFKSQTVCLGTYVGLFMLGTSCLGNEAANISYYDHITFNNQHNEYKHKSAWLCR